MGNIRLVYCTSCGAVFNADYVGLEPIRHRIGDPPTDYAGSPCMICKAKGHNWSPVDELQVRNIFTGGDGQA